MTPEEARARDLRREVRLAHDVLQRHRWADSLTALALDEAVDDVVVAGAPRSLQAGTLDSLRVRIREELARAGIGAPRAVVGFFVQPRDFAGLPGLPRDSRTTSETYMGHVDGRAYCYRVLVTPATVSPNHGGIRRYHWTEDESFSNVLGGCRVVARHGLPGPAVHRWLERGGLDFAHEPVYGPLRRRLPPAATTPSPFGRTVPFWARTLDMDRCLAGIAAACEAAVLDPLVRRGELEADVLHVIQRSPVTSLERAVFGSPFGSWDDYMLGDLEVEFGSDRFAAFWRSGLEVPQAFQAAFGVPLGEWIVSWSGAHLPRTPAGPVLPSGANSAIALFLMVCALLAGAITRRRRVA
jgi:hypothetical protein